LTQKLIQNSHTDLHNITIGLQKKNKGEVCCWPTRVQGHAL